ERAGDLAPLDALLAAADGPRLHEGDRLALRGVLEDVARLAKLPPQRLGRLRVLLKTLDHTRALYGHELEAALAVRPLASGRPARPAWSAYAAEAAQEYPPETVIEELLQAAPTTEQQAAPSAKGESPVEQARREEWSGAQLPLDTVLLTFDDGPHPVYTRQVLDILARYRVKAIFFQVGQNLGEVRDGKPELTRNEDVERLILAGGHAVGNHSYDHPFLPKLNEAQVDREIDDTRELIDAAVPPGPSRTDLFRPPYGARNPLVLGEIAERHLRSVLWNIDSMDWADPVPQSIVHRVVQELEKQGRGIVLMHDIHARTVEALPLLLDELVRRGFRFAWWDGQGLAVPPAKTD
ncbi:MAG TPA: polysaccharide deacetylase family protein, partial [Rhodocyclaceae bacterium]|nr:polysaccharide deacetylase family protein [Rhodocyclaceae bacterium]